MKNAKKKKEASSEYKNTCKNPSTYTNKTWKNKDWSAQTATQSLNRLMVFWIEMGSLCNVARSMSQGSVLGVQLSPVEWKGQDIQRANVRRYFADCQTRWMVGARLSRRHTACGKRMWSESKLQISKGSNKTVDVVQDGEKKKERRSRNWRLIIKFVS